MQEVLNVDFEKQTVSARELYSELEVTDRFSRWFERMVAYGFVENEDFTSVKSSTVVNNGAIRELQDYQLSVDMAKHICMLQRTDKAKMVRQYLIDLEKAWNTPEQVMARGLQASQRLLEQKEADIKKLTIECDRMKPKEIFADAVATSQTSILVGDLAKLLKQNGIDIGQNRLFKWLRDKGYLIKQNGQSWNMPTQKSMELQLFEVKETTINNPDGSVRISKTTKVTGKGQQYFVNKFLNNIKF